MTIRASRRALLGAASVLLGVSAPWALMGRPVAAHGEDDGSPAGPADVELPPPLGETDLRVYVTATGHTLGGVFLDYWRATGGATVYGNPISEPFAAANGYHSQAFERGIFQYRPEFLFTDEPIIRLMPIGALALAARVGVVRADGKRGGGGGDRRAPAWQSVAATADAGGEIGADGGDAGLGRAISGVFGEWYERHEGHFYLGRLLGEPVAERGRLVQYFEGGVLTREGASARLAPLAAELASRLGIETERVPRNGLPDYDESLFLTAENPNPVGRADDAGPKRIEINLSDQRLWAYQGDVLVTTGLVTTGLAPNTTEQGRFRIRLKYPVQDMAGFTGATGEVLAVDDGANAAVAGAVGTYEVADVPDVMYFNMDAALQGAFAEHRRALARLGVEAREVRLPADLEGVEAVIIPGGESTAIGKLLARTGLDGSIRVRVDAGMPVWGTCAGMILLATDVGASGSRTGPPQPLLGLMDLRVRRNAFGAQLESFETTLDAPAVSPRPVPAVFIRAPVIEAVGPAVEVLAALADGRPVAARQGPLLATAFHPELTDDLAFHRYFIDEIAAAGSRSMLPPRCSMGRVSHGAEMFGEVPQRHDHPR